MPSVETPPVEQQRFNLEAFADTLVGQLSPERQRQIAQGLANGSILSLFVNVRPKLGLSVLLLNSNGSTREMGRFGLAEADEE